MPDPGDLQDWMSFYLYKEVIGIESPHTARAKTYDVHKLLAFSRHANIPSVSSWDRAFSNSFITALEKEYAIGTVHRIYATVTNFARFLIVVSRLSFSPSSPILLTTKRPGATPQTSAAQPTFTPS
jgi:site-specific recombinase XerD